MTARNSQKELRAQFSEQLKCLDSKLDLDVTVMSELHEFYRRRALVEQEYSDALAKLVNSLKHKHSCETGKRPSWTNYTTTTLWNTLLGSTLRLSDAHATLSDIFGKHMVQRLTDMDEDANRLHKQCREMMIRCQEKVFSNIAKLQSDQREYGQRQSTQMDSDRICKRSEEKLTTALNYIQSKKKEPEKSQKFRRAQADYNQKCQAYENTVLATNHARNEYLIQLCAANQSVHRYFTDEVSDILDCMSCGLHNSLARAAMMHLSCEEAMKTCHGLVGEAINRNITALDWRADKTTFLRRNEAAFSRPPAFMFLPFKDDCESEVTAVPPLRDSLAATAADLRANLDQLKASTEEAWNNLQDIEKRLLVLINQNDYDVSELFTDPTFSGKRRRRRSVSPVNGDTARPLPTSPSANTSGPAAAASYSSLNKGSAGVGGSSGSGGGNTPLSSSLPPEEMGSKASVGSSGAEIQPGLYLSMRTAYREQRIREERIYMERFSAYTQEMHRCAVMQAKLSEIERALAKQQPVTSSKSSKRPSALHAQLSTPPSLHLQRPSYLSPLPGGGGDDAGSMVTASTPSGEAGLKTPFGTPPPPPPPATTPPPTTIAGAAVGPAAFVKIATRRVLQVPNVGRPKLFGGTIDEYVTKTGEQIPRVVLSCIRVINLYGMHHQGVFRVPGSQTEIANFKEAFEYGEDPLVGLSDARDINSTAGLLKLYFRELGEPPFPKAVFMELVKTVREKRDSDECVDRLASVISSGLSHSVFIVMRYLFAFLNHLAEYSDENMMDPYNLAICFGPTLMPSPPDLDQVEFQSNVNDVVKLCINHHRRIFDPTVPGVYYEKFAAYASAVPPVLPRAIVSEAVKKACSLRRQITAPVAPTTTDQEASAVTPQFSSQSGTSTSPAVPSRTSPYRVGDKQAFSIDQLSIDDGLDNENDDESDSDIEDDDDPQPLHATALATFVGTSARELSFQRGAELLLYRRLNEHWWEGQPAGEPEGPRYLVPHLYLKLLVAETSLVSRPSITAATVTAGTTTDESTSGVDDDALSASIPIATANSSLAGKFRGHVSAETESGSFAAVITPALTSTKSSSVATFDPLKEAVLESSSTPPGSGSATSPTDPKAADGDGNETVIQSGDTVKKNLFIEAKETIDAKPVDFPADHEARNEQTGIKPILFPSPMVRSVSNSPPPLSPQRRSDNRCSWSCLPTSSPIDSSATSTVSGLETLPEDKPVNIKPCLKLLITENQGSAANESAAFVDPTLAEVVREGTILEDDHSRNRETNMTAKRRSHEEEGKICLSSTAQHTPDPVFGLPDRPQPPNWGRSLEKSSEEDSATSPKNSADTFAEQAESTVRKRVNTRMGHLTEVPKPLSTSASLGADLSRSESTSKSIAATSTWWSARKLGSQTEEEGKESTMSKSLVGENKGVEKENVTTSGVTDSPIPIKRGSIAARVAAFEASSSSNTSNISPLRPGWVRKT